MVVNNKQQHLPCYLPQSLSTKSIYKKKTAVTQSYCKRKRTMRRVSFYNKLEYINGKSTMKNTYKKRRTHTQRIPSHDSAPSAIGRAWRYDNDDVSYCSDS